MYIDSTRLIFDPWFRGDANIVIYCLMENREQQILSEIKSMMASIRSQLERLDAKMAELQQVVDPEEFDSTPIDIEIDETVPVAGLPVEELQTVEVQEIPLEVEDDLPLEETPEDVLEDVLEDELVEEIQVEEAPESIEDVLRDLPAAVEEETVEEETVEEETVEEEDDDLPGVFDIPEPVTVADKASVEAKPILNEVITADYAWRKDMPGTPVRDIRSAISLNDRVIFINLLFKEDAQAFVDTLSKINAMETLDQAVGFVCASFPEWDLSSELVYRFMMAVRRKVR